MEVGKNQKLQNKSCDFKQNQLKLQQRKNSFKEQRELETIEKEMPIRKKRAKF
jgi:hypothetical protein